ncbi:hypothetical protein EJ04DRAFT_510941 [Polyplosphaeria fusca]|uniref:Uncharacterized protein n=1 Tax=Polyplosphaeria fusca TaxID=682080 RepID=A0A9P4V5Q9_9PLEO|nr:hypothetical protein EJ04DRAFT_510941 [Polyplosphaeria fusca]
MTGRIKYITSVLNLYLSSSCLSISSLQQLPYPQTVSHDFNSNDISARDQRQTAAL